MRRRQDDNISFSGGQHYAILAYAQALNYDFVSQDAHFMAQADITVALERFR